MSDDGTTGEPCAACKAIGHPEGWQTPPRCAFPDGKPFQTHNWMCGSLTGLRDQCDRQFEARKGALWHDDQNTVVIAVPPPWSEADVAAFPFPRGASVVVIDYYKSRGRTEGAWVLCDDGTPPRAITLGEALWLGQWYENGGRKR